MWCDLLMIVDLVWEQFNMRSVILWLSSISLSLRLICWNIAKKHSSTLWQWDIYSIQMWCHNIPRSIALSNIIIMWSPYHVFHPKKIHETQYVVHWAQSALITYVQFKFHVIDLMGNYSHGWIASADTRPNHLLSNDFQHKPPAFTFDRAQQFRLSFNLCTHGQLPNSINFPSFFPAHAAATLKLQAGPAGYLLKCELREVVKWAESTEYLNPAIQDSFPFVFILLKKQPNRSQLEFGTWKTLPENILGVYSLII